MTTPSAPLNWAAPYRTKRDLYWPEVEGFFSQLPPQLRQQSVLLRNNLATFYSETGQFKDILSRPHDHPLLYWHFWLLNDWRYPQEADRAEIERHLFLAMTFALAAVYIQECILDASSNFDNSCLFLAQTLSQQSDYHLAHLFPASAPFWQQQRLLWQQTAEANLLPLHPSSPSPHLLAFTKIPLVAVTFKTERGELWPQLEAMLDRLNGVIQILREISTLRRDLNQRRLTYPILKTMQAAGLDPLQPVSPEQLLGALVLTGTIEKMGLACLTELEAGRVIAESLHLPAFTAYFEGVAGWVNEVRAMFSLKAKAQAKPVPSQRSPFFMPYVEPLPKVIEMAEGYLLADLTFRESWEVQRRGVFGTMAMTGKAFPMGLIAEILSRHGHDMSAPINEVFETLRASGFRYYDHPHLPPDTDDLGLLLRLYPYSTQPAQHREILQTPLRWLEAEITEAKGIPVWLRAGVANPQDYPFLALWGQHCATVEANLLLGLIAYDKAGYQDLLAKAVANWCQRVIPQGLSATHHYVPLYALWTGFELLKVIHDGGFTTIQHGADRAFQTLLNHLTREVRHPQPSPQAAAFLSLAYLSAKKQKISRVFETLEVLLSDWLTFLGKTQRYDGSWAAEPLYGTPTRGEFAAWYSSRTMTTAFCYDALKRSREERG